MLALKEISHVAAMLYVSREREICTFVHVKMGITKLEEIAKVRWHKLLMGVMHKL
jgi:hypothetical protein